VKLGARLKTGAIAAFDFAPNRRAVLVMDGTDMGTAPAGLFEVVLHVIHEPSVLPRRTG
jgi:hypothetical protein